MAGVFENMRPPRRFFDSYTVTFVNPASTSVSAADRPEMPAPTIAMRGCTAGASEPSARAMRGSASRPAAAPAPARNVRRDNPRFGPPSSRGFAASACRANRINDRSAAVLAIVHATVARAAGQAARGAHAHPFYGQIIEIG